MEGSMTRGRPRKNPRREEHETEGAPRRASESGFTCKRCFQGKIKCDRGTPCSRCVRLNYPCEPHCVRPGRPRKRADSPGLSARDDVTVRPRGPRSEAAAGPPHHRRESSSLITASATAESPEGVTPPRAPSLHRVSPPRAAKAPETTRWPVHEASDHACGGLLSRLTPPAPAPRQAPPAFEAGEVRPDLQHQRPPPPERLGLKRPLSPARDGARADTGGQNEAQMEALRRLHLAAVLHQAAADEEERKRRHAIMAAAASQHSSASSARVAAAPAPPPMSSRSVLDLLADGAARERSGSLSHGWPVAPPHPPPPPAPRPPTALPLAREVGFHATAALMHMPPSRNSSSHGTVYLDWQQRGGGSHPAQAHHQPPPHQHQPQQQQQHQHSLRFLQPQQQQRQQLPAQESWLRRAMAAGVDEPKARGILLSWQYFCLLHAGRDTTDGLLEVMSSSLRLSLPCRVPPLPSQPTVEDTAISAHLKGLYDGLLPHQALCCVQWALASAVPSANQHFTNMFGRIDHDLDQGLVPVSLWARMVESCSEEDYWHLVLQATFNSTGTSDARCLKVRDRHGASFWALCRIGAHASPCGWHAFTCIIIEPTGL